MIGITKAIKLLKYTTTVDANGDAQETLANTYKLWAEVSDNGGGRSQADGRTDASDTKIFKINFRNYPITPDFKIEYFGQIYSISNARRVNEQRFYWEITAFNIYEVNA